MEEGEEVVVVEEVVQQLLLGDSDTVLRSRRRDLPELLHRAGALSLEQGVEGRRRFLLLAGKVVRYNPGLVSHLEGWVVKCGAPWHQEEQERSIKRPRLEEEGLSYDLLASCCWLLASCPRLRRCWTWTGLFSLLPQSSTDTRFLIIELLRLLFHLEERVVTSLRSDLLPSSSLPQLLITYKVQELLQAGALAQDFQQEQEMVLEQEQVARVGHLALVREGKEGKGASLVEVPSTCQALSDVAGAVAVGRPVLLLGEAGSGKTSLVRELARKTGRTLLTLQVW